MGEGVLGGRWVVGDGEVVVGESALSVVSA